MSAISDPRRGRTSNTTRSGMAGAAKTPPTAPASLFAASIPVTRSAGDRTAPDRRAAKERRFQIICRSEQSVTPSHAAPAQPNTRDFEVGWQLFPALAATGAGRGGQGGWSLAYLSVSRICSAYRRVLGGLGDYGANYTADAFKRLISVGAAHGGTMTNGVSQWKAKVFPNLTRVLSRTV